MSTSLSDTNTEPTNPLSRDAASEAADEDLAAVAAKLAEADAQAYWREMPRTDAKIAALLSVITALIAAGGLVAALLPRKQTLVAFVLLGGAGLTAFAALILLILVMVPVLGGPLQQIAQLPTAEAAREHYLVAGKDPLAHHAASSRLTAQIAVRRFSKIRRAAFIELAALPQLLLGLAALWLGW